MVSAGTSTKPNLTGNVLTMGLTSMLATFGNTLWFYFLPVYYSNVFSASPSQISVIYAAWLTASAIGSSPAGALADSIGRKKIIVFSSFVSAAAIFVFAFSHNFILSAIAFPISGLGSSFFMVSNTLIAESVETRNRGSAFGIFSSLSTLAAAFSPIIGGIAISTNGYMPLFLVGGTLTLAAAVLRLFYLKETLQTSDRIPSKGNFLAKYSDAIKSIAGNRVLIVLLIAYSVYNIFAEQNSFITPLYATKALGYNTITTGALFSVLLAVVAISRFPFGKLSDRIGREKTVVISWVGEILSVYLFVFATSPGIAILGIGVWMLFGVMDAPAINAWVAEASESRHRGLSMGVFYTLTFVPTIPALIISGYLFSIRPQFPFYANTVISVVALVLLIAFTRIRRNTKP
ncbi:MAG: MFS transporter [Thaumarchaeota archaeon]|nr:MFS transporter [Nitrososphaerota archaeon]